MGLFTASFNWLGLIVFFVVFILLLAGIIFYSRLTQIHSFIFWIISIFGAVIVAYLITFLI